MAGAGGKKNLFMIIGLVVLVGGVGFGGYMMGSGGKAKATTQAGEDPVNAEVAADAKGETKSEGGHGEAKAEPKKEESGGHGGGHGGHGAAEPEPPKELTKTDLTYSFDPFIVNLFDPSARTLLRTTISIEAKDAEALAKVKDNVIPLRDVTVTILSSKTSQEVLRPDGKDRIKTELRARYEGKLGQKVINEVYIGDILVNNQ